MKYAIKCLGDLENLFISMTYKEIRLKSLACKLKKENEVMRGFIQDLLAMAHIDGRAKHTKVKMIEEYIEGKKEANNDK